MMKSLIYFFVLCIALSTVEAQFPKKYFPSLKHANPVPNFRIGSHSNITIPNKSTAEGGVTYVEFSNSVNGPFSSTFTCLTTDSFFIKMDVTTGGIVFVEFYVDVNKNCLSEQNFNKT